MVQKSSVTDTNASYVQRLRVAENATNQEIQAALHELFNKGPQGPSRRQDTNSDEATSPQGEITHVAIISSTAISKIQLDSEIKNLLSSVLRQEALYSQILSELAGGSRQKILNDLIFNCKFFINGSRPEARWKS